MSGTRLSRPPSDVLRAAIVTLTLATAYIHLSLGGLLFTLNAIGYVVGAAAMVLPIDLAARYRWLIRMGLAGYAATTIVGWLIQPAFYSTAYLAKAIELVLIALLVIDFARHDGNPIERLRHEIRSMLARVERPRGPRPLRIRAGLTAESGPVTPVAVAEASTQRMTVLVSNEMHFSPSTLVVKAGAPVELTLRNLRPGTYRLICSVQAHADAGAHVTLRAEP